VENSWAKILGVVVLLAPAPPRIKEWAYAGFAIDLGSALIATSRWATVRRRGAGRGDRRAVGALVLLLAPLQAAPVRMAT